MEITVFCINKYKTIGDAAKLLIKYECNSLPVNDEKQMVRMIKALLENKDCICCSTINDISIKV